MNLPDTFGAKTMQSTCIVWVGATNSRGYGVLTIDGQPQLAHRIAYEAARGPIPDGMVLDHLCRVRNCVKVDHLDVVTTAENTRRGRAAASLQVGDRCINGHEITDAADLYTKPTGRTECQWCRRASAHRPRVARQTAQRRAGAVLAAVVAADGAAS